MGFEFIFSSFSAPQILKQKFRLDFSDTFNVAVYKRNASTEFGNRGCDCSWNTSVKI